MKKLLFVLIIIFILGGIGGFLAYKKYHKTQLQTRSAVFMTNGQVYFGYLKGSNSQTIDLDDVYYLKTTELQNSISKKIILVKMGNELHGPTGNMSINRDQILYWQTLSDDSKVNDAISRFNQAVQTVPATTTTQ